MSGPRRLEDVAGSAYTIFIARTIGGSSSTTSTRSAFVVGDCRGMISPVCSGVRVRQRRHAGDCPERRVHRGGRAGWSAR